MSQRQNNQQQSVASPSIQDIHAARRQALGVASDIMYYHTKERTIPDGHDEYNDWCDLRAQMHHAVIQFYQTLKPHLLDNGVKYNDNAIVTELDDGVFYINQLDDFRLSYVDQDQEQDQIGGGTKKQKKRVPHTLTPELSLECLDYLNKSMVDLGLTVKTELKNDVSDVASDKADMDAITGKDDPGVDNSKDS